MHQTRIFVSSPSDVADERLAARRLIDELGREFSERSDIQAMLWENEPLLASADFQSQIESPQEADIFILIMGERIGSPLGEEFRRADGSRFASATEYEFETALAAFNETGKPRMLAYRKQALPSAVTSNQREKVDEFFANWFVNPMDQTATGAYHSFKDVQTFTDLLEIHLRKSLADILPPPTNLPMPVSSFIGREELIEDIQGMLVQKDTRLVILVAPGGSGKTRAAIEIGHRLLPEFREGVFFVNLAAITNPDMVASTIATTLGINAGEDVLETLTREFRRMSLLLIVDNFEQVKAAGIHLSRLLAECPELKIIVTSRITLRLSGARIVQVPPLQMPAAVRTYKPAELERHEAVSLFLQRAREVSASFDITDENAVDIVEICRHVDALPLAIELAASRIRAMTPKRILDGLAQRFRLLKGGSDDALDRQQSLDACIAWSYNLLSEEEQILWRRLSIFPAGCSVELAQEICDTNDDYLVEIDIEHLVDANLVYLEETDSMLRIRMLESLREYAYEELRRSDDFVHISQKFCQWWLRTLDQNEGNDFVKLKALYAFLDTEIQNVRFALRLAIDAQRSELAMRLTGRLYMYWEVRGLAPEGIDWLTQVFELDCNRESQHFARMLYIYGSLLKNAGDIEEALAKAKESLAIYEVLESQNDIHKVQGLIGGLYLNMNDFESARHYLGRSMASEIQVRENVAWALNSLGVIEHVEGNLEAAVAFYQQALDKLNANDLRLKANLLFNLGEIAQLTGGHHKARANYVEALQLAGGLEDKHLVAYCAELIAGFEVRLGDPAEAAFLFGAADDIRDKIEVEIESYNAERIETDKALVRGALSEEQFNASYENGVRLGVNGVLRHCLQSSQ